LKTKDRPQKYVAETARNEGLKCKIEQVSGGFGQVMVGSKEAGDLSSNPWRQIVPEMLQLQAFTVITSTQ
jgi:hypothetical protein